MKTIKQHMLILLVIALAIGFSSCSKSGAAKSNKSTVTVSTFAGSGTMGSANGTGTAASFLYPSGIVSSGNGALYIGDFGNNLIRTINISSAAVNIVAGTGTAGLINGSVTAAAFNGPANIALDASGDLFISDEENNVIREITSAGNVSTVAGAGIAGYQDGAAGTAEFNFPEGIVVDANGDLYVADGHNSVIRKITMSTGMVSTYAGIAGTTGFANGAVSSATFNEPYGLALDNSGNLYVTDILNNSIRKITVSTNTVSTYAGTGTKGFSNGTAATATFYYPLGCVLDSQGNLYVSDTYNNVIRKVSTSGNVTTFAGTGAQGSADGDAASATFNFPIGISVYGNAVFVADTHNNVIRKITIGQ